MLGLLKYSDDFSRAQGLNQPWKKDKATTAVVADNTGFNARQSYLIASSTAKGTFSFRVPLKHIFGFCEDYDKIVYGLKHTLIIIIIISTTMFMVLSSWQSHCESSPGSFDECRMAPSGRRPKTKPDDLGCESACTGCQKLHPPSPFIITQPES